MENENIRINFPDGKSEELDRRRLALHTHIGKLALYDHVRMKRDDDSIVVLFSNRNTYAPLVNVIEKYQYPMYLNKPDVEPMIENLYLEDSLKDLDDTIPKEWGDKNEG